MSLEAPTDPDENAIRQEARKAGAQAAYEYLAPFHGIRTSSMEAEAQRRAQLAEGQILARHGLLNPREIPAVQAIYDEAGRIGNEVRSTMLSRTDGFLGSHLEAANRNAETAREEHLAKYGLLNSKI